MRKIFGIGILFLFLLTGCSSNNHKVEAATINGSIAPMPVISRNCPSYASDAPQDAHLANDDSYKTVWRGNRKPNKDKPCWITYDLSKSNVKRAVVTWFNAATYPYDHLLWNMGPGYGLPGDYTIDANAAAGGRLPTTGWVSLVTVKGNTYHSRTHIIDFSGYRWIRMTITATDGTVWNDDPFFNMDVHDASKGVQDTWLFLGDSITAGGMPPTDPSFASLVHKKNPLYFPTQENGGEGGFRSDTGLTYIDKWLKVYPGHFVTLSYGTNDINTFKDDQDAVNKTIANLTTLANKVIAAGKTPIIPHVPWAKIESIQSNGILLNTKIDMLTESNKKILAGPDLYAFFKSHPNLIGGDKLHPTEEGYKAYCAVWADWACKNIYQKSSK